MTESASPQTHDRTDAYFVAELGINHNGSRTMAYAMMDAAKWAGVQAVKFQKRTVEAVYTPEELARPRESPFGHTNGDLKRALELTVEDYEAIARYAGSLGLQWGVSVWDPASAHEMAGLQPHFLKVPSPCLTDVAVLKAVRDECAARKGMEPVVSTGMSTQAEIRAAWEIMTGAPACGPGDGPGAQPPNRPGARPPNRPGARPPRLLHCVSAYPTELPDTRLGCIFALALGLASKVGYSSHTGRTEDLLAAVDMVRWLEFHFTLSRAIWGSDQPMSLEPGQVRGMIEEAQAMTACWTTPGWERERYACELAAWKKLRRSP